MISMISRRAFVLGLVPTVLAFDALQSAEPAAKDFVETIYAAYKGKDANGISLSRPADVRRYFEPSLATLIIRYAAAANKRNEVGALGGDPFVDAQDWEIDAFDIAVRETAARKAVGTVAFMNMGSAVNITLDLVRLASGWRIAEIKYDRHQSLRSLFKKPPKR